MIVKIVHLLSTLMVRDSKSFIDIVTLLSFKEMCVVLTTVSSMVVVLKFTWDVVPQSMMNSGILVVTQKDDK